MVKELNNGLINQLRDVITKTNIFIEDENEKEKYNFICAMMDRLETSVYYINTNNKIPKNDNGLILIMVHACIIKDSINETLKILELEIERTYFFRKLCEDEPFNILSEKYISDDKIFEYFRSLIFAHPLKTSISIPNKISKKEIQYSPYVLPNIPMNSLYRNGKNAIGAMVYSNERDMFPVFIDFDLLITYLREKYLNVKRIIESFDNIIEEKKNLWKKRKVNRDLDPIDVLKDIISILCERYEETYSIKELIDYLNCECSNPCNKIIMDKYKKKIENNIPNICDCIDNMDDQGLYDSIETIFHEHVKGYPMVHYHVEKIFGYLTYEPNSGNIEFGKQMADAFSKEFAKNWVVIDAFNMPFTEIKFLTKIACKEQYELEKRSK